MDWYDVLRLSLRVLELLAWPSVALVAILLVRPHLSELLSGANVKLSIAGQVIETTLPELRQIIEEQSGAALTQEQIEYLLSLQRAGVRTYPDGVDKSADRKFLRPLRNSGLVATVPRNAFLNDAQGIELTALGRLYLRATGVPARSAA